MGRYTYTIHKTGEEPIKKQTFYIYSDLIKMTTYQLKEICYKERLVKNVLTTLDQEELIRLIMRYRGRKKALFIKDYEEEGLLRLEHFLKKTKKIELRDMDIRIPAKMNLYEEIDLDYFDHYDVKTKEILSEGNLLLVDEEYQVYSVFNLKSTPNGDYYLAKNGKVPVKEAKGKQ